MNATFTMPIRNCNATARFVMRIALCIEGIVALALLEVCELVAQPSPSRPHPERINTCKPEGKRLAQTENTMSRYAQSVGMEFFADVIEPRQDECDYSIEGIHQRASRHTTVLDGILQHHQNRNRDKGL
jgi:hypothetical protein